MYGQSIPQDTVQNTTTKENPETLPKNLYTVDSLTVQPLDFTMLSGAAEVPVPHGDTTETMYKLGQIVCVKTDSNDSYQLIIIACLQENVSVGMKRVKDVVFIQVPFNPVLFTEDAGIYVDVSNINIKFKQWNDYGVQG